MRSIKRAFSKKRMLVLSLLILLLCISVGYSVLSQRLKINTAASIAKTIWDVHFENVKVIDGSVGATIPVISDDKTTITLQVSLSTPGDFYAYYVDVVNNGTIHAKVESLIKSNLTSTQSNYLEYKVTYADGVEINKEDALKVGERDTLKIIIQFKPMTDPSLLPSNPENLNLESQMVYVQDMGDGVPRKRGLHYVLESKAISDESINFGAISSDTNGLGVYKLTKIATGRPIYYYRGDVKNNHVLFANFCWKMIRTTETEGVKLIYDGIPNNGICDNTGTTSEIAQTPYHIEDSDLKYLGYMYDNNTKNSTIKTVVDGWFSANLLSYLDYLEDTPFYNERDYVLENNVIIFCPGYRIWGNAIVGGEAMSMNVKNTTIKLGTVNKEDIFTVSASIGNGALTYPVGLLTSDEAIMAGGRGYASDQDFGWNTHYYLWTNSSFWTMSPFTNRIIGVFPGGDLYSHIRIVEDAGARPVLSLKKGCVYSRGDGTSDNPYIVS